MFNKHLNHQDNGCGGPAAATMRVEATAIEVQAAMEMWATMVGGSNIKGQCRIRSRGQGND